MGAGDRRRWSSFIRQDLVQAATAKLIDGENYGLVLLGSGGVGKTTLARSVENEISGHVHVVKLFGSATETAVPYGLWGVQLARLHSQNENTPNSIIQGIADLIQADADGLDVVLVIDDLPGVDTLSMGVLMHLIFSGIVKVLVLARSTNDLPEDLMWLRKDGMLSEMLLENFSKGEVRTLVTKALGGSIAAAAVAALHESSGGNPLVLHTLIHEEMGNGHLVQHNGTWVLSRERLTSPSILLAELVEARLSRETAEVRRGVAMMSLIQRAPLSMVIDVLGTDTVAQMEEHNYLTLSRHARRYTSLAEPFIGETVRAMMGMEEKAQLYREMIEAVPIDPEKLSRQELLAFAAWAVDAGMPVKPETSLSAAKAALMYLDPRLALTFVSALPENTSLTVFGAVLRSSAYSMLADYPRAVEELQEVKELAESLADIDHFAYWVAALAGALVWVEGGLEKVPELLEAAMAHIDEIGQDLDQQDRANKALNFALLAHQVNCGLFSEAAPGLEAGYWQIEDSRYSLACGSLLVLVWAFTGRELDAINLAREIGQHPDGKYQDPGLLDLQIQGLLIAHTWSGQWKHGVEVLTQMLATMGRYSEHHGGLIELGLGISYAFAGKAAEASEILLVAAAQLEIRDVYNCTHIAYSALAWAFADVGNDAEAAKYLALVHGAHPNTTWVNLAMAEYFTLIAEYRMGDPNAADDLVESAKENIAAGRYTLASVSLLASTANGCESDLRLLETTSAMGQGPLAEVSNLLAQASLEKDVDKALQAAAAAEDLELAAIKSRCAELALELATKAGDHQRVEEAQVWLNGLQPAGPVQLAFKETEGFKLTQRELQVARLAAKGMGNRAIADVMRVSIRTIEGHLYQVFAKLGINSRHDLV
ncbi:regulatory protein, luxR family [Arthrobacter alpinus]|uniref:Regulatory protein, luxR family n=1 Tax=Arthrobacter alpinus TaxID=656366 RepID=A0A1H5KLI3_9MICC|nr:LuxR C-terminal-related transcriptional regulator [Arthrobacter alpinus]SEE64961.1 regulatory protein, luxR family [Arthrobacter alpinus]